jgi:hypothetical protein
MPNIEIFEPDMTFKPMKGAHLVLNESILSWLQGRLDEVHEIGGYGEMDDNVEQDVKALLDELLKVADWYEVKDRFGRKVFASRPYAVSGQQEQRGELRVGVVLTRGELMLDIRVWGVY